MAIKADLNGVKIAAIASAVSKNEEDLSKYREKFGNENVNKFSAMTGVKKRRIANENQTASDLAYAAAKHLIEAEEINPKEIGACIFITQTPDYRLPSTACVLQRRLGLSINCLAFDVNLGCSGYVYGINIAASLMKTNNISKCLLLAGDTINKCVSDDDRSTSMLFGDAGAANLLTLDNSALMSGSFKTDGNGFKYIIIPDGAYRNTNIVSKMFDIYMDGTNVFSFTISEVPKIIKEHLADIGENVNSFDTFAMHQANCYILKQVAKKTKIPLDKMPISMDRYGNTSVSSIPLTLCDIYGDKIERIKTLMCGFGVGLSWGVVSAEIDTMHIYPIIETEDYYKEGALSHD